MKTRIQMLSCPDDSEHVVEHFIVSYISNNNLMFKLDILYKSSSMCFCKQSMKLELEQILVGKLCCRFDNNIQRDFHPAALRQQQIMRNKT